MRADIGFAWIVFFAFLAWIFQVLRASGQTGGRRPPAPPRPYRSDSLKPEGQRLEELIRHLEDRLGQEEGRGKTTVVVQRPAPPQRPRLRAVPPKPKVTEAAEGRTLEAPVDREAEAEAIERKRLQAAAARDQGLTNADYAAFEVRVRADRVAGTSVRAAFVRPTARQLRDAFVWNEILGPPVGLRQ